MKASSGRSRLGQKNGQAGGRFDMVQRMGPKVVNGCRLEQMDTKEFGKMVRRIQILQEGRTPAKEAKNWRIEGEKKRITRKEF